MRKYTIHFIYFILVIDLIFIIDVIFILSSIIHLNWKLTGPVKPQPVVPLAVLFSGNLPVLGSGVEAGMTQVLQHQKFSPLDRLNLRK